MLCQGWRSYMLNPDKVIFREAFAPPKNQKRVLVYNGRIINLYTNRPSS